MAYFLGSDNRLIVSTIMGAEMKATFKTSDEVDIKKYSWFSKISTPYCQLLVTIEFTPEEINAIKRLGTHRNNLVDSDNIHYSPNAKPPSGIEPDEELLNYIKERFHKKSEQNILSDFFDKPKKLKYRNLFNAQQAIHQIKEQLTIIKGNIDAPDPDETFEV